MKIIRLVINALWMCTASCMVQEKQVQEITIDLQDKGTELSETMYGIFFEEINHAGDGGLYGELVKNRSFEELEYPEGYSVRDGKLFAPPIRDHITQKIQNRTFKWTNEKIPGWKLMPDDSSIITGRVTKQKPNFASAPNNLEVIISDDKKSASLINEGYWGMGLSEGEKYRLRLILRTDGSYQGNLKVKLAGKNDILLDSCSIMLSGDNAWHEYGALLVSRATDAYGKLVLEFDSKGKLWIDYVSLFPENTYRQRPNGLRKDLAEFLTGLKPSFVRWPGGCVVEGITLNNRYEWKKTLGDPASRPGQYSTWGYRCSYGFGYHEFLQFCEDIAADAMFVCNVGLACQWRSGEACPEKEISHYLQDAMDAIEYALGDTITEWGARRKLAGHPREFPLKYIEIGNENWGDEYDKRFDLFYNAIKKKYPQLILISNHGMGGTDKITKTDMIDPHWYAIPGFFLNNSDIFDRSPRGKYKVYVGEYACNRSVGGGNMLAALSEAAFITGMERNSDLVTMTSYAPLLENKNNREWAVNLVWFDSHQVVGRSSYYVQKMFADHKPDFMVKSSFTHAQAKPKPLVPGYIAVKTEGTAAEYDDIALTNSDDQHLSAIDSFIYKMDEADEYTLKFKAKRNHAGQGIQVFIGEDKECRTGYLLSIGRHASSSVVIQYFVNNNMTGYVGYGKNVALDNDKWYEVQISVDGNVISAELNNEPVLNFPAQDYPRQFMSTSYDRNKEELIIKMVNADSVDFHTKINLNGISSVDRSGKMIVLAADSLQAENSFENPTMIIPVISNFNQFDNSFRFQFKPFSLTILRIKTAL